MNIPNVRDFGNVVVDLVSLKWNMWDFSSRRRSMPMDLALGRWDGKASFVQVWLCPPHKIQAGRTPSVVIYDRRWQVVEAYARAEEAQRRFDEYPYSYGGIASEWEAFDEAFKAPGRLRLVEFANGSWFFELTDDLDSDEVVRLFHAHQLTMIQDEEFKIAESNPLWSWQWKEEVWCGDHYLYRATITDFDQADPRLNHREVVEIGWAEYEDIYDDDAEVEDGMMPPIKDSVYHRYAARITVGATVTEEVLGEIN